MTPQEKDELIAKELQTPEGKKKFRAAFELASAKAADKFPEWSVGWCLGRALAGLPIPTN
jgi:hypothetical protein